MVPRWANSPEETGVHDTHQIQTSVSDQACRENIAGPARQWQATAIVERRRSFTAVPGPNSPFTDGLQGIGVVHTMVLDGRQHKQENRPAYGCRSWDYRLAQLFLPRDGN